MTRMVISPSGASYPDDDNEGPLRVVGHDDNTLDSAQNKSGWVVVQFVLSRHLNLFESRLNDVDAGNDAKIVPVSGNVTQTATFPVHLLPDVVADIDDYLQKLEKRGREARAAHEAVLAEAREKLAELFT